MPRSLTARAWCTALAFGLALGCTDAGGPVGPRQMVIAAGDSQSANLGATLSTR